MATVLPAMQGRMGTTDYWIVTMPAKELTERLTIPENVEGWEDMSVEERYQRDINYRRVRDQIAPYLTNDEDRFFGSFIVSIIHPDQVAFEPLGSLVSKIPNLYKQAGSAFGFLTLAGHEVLVPLDGQHRLAALEFAITGKDQKQNAIRGLDASIDVASDTCTVILMRHDGLKSRRIFNKVNRYAKKTTKADDLITADDDVIATIVRERVADDPIVPGRLVNYRSNTLSNKTHEFTTLATLYEATKILLEDTHGKIDTQSLPDQAAIKIMRDEAVEFWTTVCEKVDHFASALRDSGTGGDEKRREIRRDLVLGKPIAQLALAQALVNVRAEDGSGARLSLDVVCRRVNELDWSVENVLWQRVLMNGDRVVTGRTAARFAARVIGYLLGERLTEGELEELVERYEEETGRELPESVL